MDAKPVRGFRIYDENALPVAQTKTLHTRNKSSPALSTLATKGALKIAAKRAAFGDISQTYRANRPLSELQTNAKEPKIQQEKKLATLLQPAQKSATTYNLVTVQPLPEISQNSQVKKVIAKRATTIFRDYSTISQGIQKENNQPLKSESVAQTLVKTTVDSTVSKPTTVLPVIHPGPQSHTTLTLDSSDLHVPVVSAEEQLSSTVKVPTTAALPEQVATLEQAPSTLDTKEAEEKILSILHNKVNQSSRPIELLPVKAIVEIPSVQPQTYTEEEYDEIYEDDGYVTARSFRSKPDNVTEGNLTTVLAPKSGIDVTKELEAAAAVVSALKEPADIDDEEWDISMVAEYKEEIFEYYHELESRLAPNPHYMDVQTEIQWSMRSVLIDWVVQVHDRFQLLPETLFLTVNIIDRFLSIKVVSINKLQLVGATALFVASKYEEVNCPTLKEMVFMVDKTYDEEEILKAERFMLTLLGFDLGWPGPMSFLRRISTADDYDLETRTVAKYFLELTIMDERFLECPPSFVSAGAHCLARLMLNKGHWSTAHVHYSGYTYLQLQPLLVSMMDCLENPVLHHNAIYEKYCSKRFRGAASFAREELRRGFQLIDNQTNTALNYEQLCQSNSIFEYVYRDIPGYSAYAYRQY